MVKNLPFDQTILEHLRSIASEGVKNAAYGFSGMIGRKVRVGQTKGRFVPILTLPEIVGRPEEEAVGIYLRFEGDMVGQMMMIIPHQKAMELVDLLLDIPAGTTQHLGPMERSSLGELGNLCGSFFLNSIADSFGADFRPSPPAVVVDMVGAILDIVVATSGGVSEQILLVEANFTDGDRCVEADFWVIPDMNTVHDLLEKSAGR